MWNQDDFVVSSAEGEKVYGVGYCHQAIETPGGTLRDYGLKREVFVGRRRRGRGTAKGESLRERCTLDVIVVDPPRKECDRLFGYGVERNAGQSNCVYYV